MMFNTYSFMLLFLPLTVFLYFQFIKRSGTAGKIFLFICSCFFIAVSGLYHLVICLLLFLLDYILNKIFDKTKNNGIVFLIILLNICCLSLFKYERFLFPDINIVFPLGLSFYVFQQISFAVDHSKGRFERYSLIDYLLYSIYFPKFIQGPLVSFELMEKQLIDDNRKCINYHNLSDGLYLLSLGLAKKVLVADNFGIIADYGYSHVNTLNSFESVLVILGYTFQIYFDFSGYSDMAVGISKMFNIELPVNFNSPYKAKNISDFWKRWHMTLTGMLTRYVYIPLGGNRKGIIRTYINIIIVFLISGLWHGNKLTFLIWGLMHGAASVLYRYSKEKYDAIPGLVQWCLNFVFINLTWIVFRASSLKDGIALLKGCFAGGFGINAELAESLLQPTIINVFSQFIPLNIVIVIAYCITLVVILICSNSNERLIEFRTNKRSLFLTYILLLLSLLSFSGVSGFLYSNF